MVIDMVIEYKVKINFRYGGIKLKKSLLIKYLNCLNQPPWP
jgi:hypothetical protein